MRDLRQLTRAELTAEVKRVEAAIKTTNSDNLKRDYKKYLARLHRTLRTGAHK